MKKARVNDRLVSATEPMFLSLLVSDLLRKAFKQYLAILSEYNPDNHIDNGFDREVRCKIRAPRGINPDKETGGNGKSPTQCCGSGLSRMVFKVDRAECCVDGSVKPLGQC